MNCINFEICQNQTENDKKTICDSCFNKIVTCELCGKEFKKGVKKSNFCTRSCETASKKKFLPVDSEKIGLSFDLPIIAPPPSEKKLKVKKEKKIKIRSEKIENKPSFSSSFSQNRKEKSEKEREKTNKILELESYIAILEMKLQTAERELEIYKSGDAPKGCARSNCKGQPLEGATHCPTCTFLGLF